MGHVRLILLLACATALVALSAPAVALAGTYAWSLPGDPGAFTGANPEQKYTKPSWTYQLDGTNFPSSDFRGSGVDGGPGWTDGSGDNIADTSGGIELDAAIGHSVTIAWTNPLNVSATVTVDTFPGPTGLCTLSKPSSTIAPGGTLSVTLNNTLGVTGCSATGTISVQGTAPNVTITAPADNSTFTAGQPEFSGAASTAFDASNAVTVHVYPGPAAAGTAVETLTTTRSGGSWTAVPTAPLPNGQYTAQAVQEDPIGSPNLSNGVTFVLSNSGPSLTLDSLGSNPLLTSSPTFNGGAGTRTQDSKTVTVLIFSGAAVSGSPVQGLTASVGSNGRFSVQSPALADGRYTALAGQLGAGLVGFSSPLTFRIKVHPPALTVNQPSAGGSLSRKNVFFSGQAGDALGDSSTITVAVYGGPKARGKALGKRTVQAHGASWSLGWRRKLRNGIYTVRAAQADDAGHTTRITHRFLVVPGPTTIGSFVSLSASGSASIPVGCVARSGTCAGSVLVVTTHGFRTTPGGPFGRLRVLFAYVQIAAGKTQTVRGAVPRLVASALRRNGGGTVRITASLSMTGRVSAIRTLKLGP